MSAEAWDGDANPAAHTKAGAAAGPRARAGQAGRGAGGGVLCVPLQGAVPIPLPWEILTLVMSFLQKGHRVCFCPPAVIFIFLFL